MRRRNGESSCYLGSDGRWHGRVSVGLKQDGSPDRRHVSGRDQEYEAVLGHDHLDPLRAATWWRTSAEQAALLTPPLKRTGC